MQRVHHLVERLPLRSKLILLAALPLCAALFAMGSLTLSARTTMNEANATTRTVSLAVAIGDLLHETQKERGSSAVYLSSGGETFGAELRAQHAATDVALDALIEQLEQSRADLDVEIASAADVVLAELAEVPSLRVAVVAVDADLGPTIRTYTGINRQLLAIIQSIEGAQPSAETARGSLAYRSVLEGKEAAGIMRAQFANAFTNDAFGDGQLAMLISLQATRNNALNQFSGFTTAELLAVDTQRRSGSAFEQVTAIETAAIASSSGNFGVDPVAWFDIKTTYINELKNLEDLQAQTILDDADRTSAASTGAFWSLIIGFLVLTTLVVALSLVVIENVIQSLQKVRSHAEEIASGTLQMPNLELPGNDEIAALGGAFDSMTDTLAILGRQIDAIATKNVLDNSLNESLPGQLGDKMHHLTEATNEQIELAAREEQHMAETVTLLADIRDRSNLLLSNSEILSEVSDELTTGAGQTSDQASSVSAAAEEASAIAKSVAVALSQLQESVVEISSSATTATATAQRAVSVSEETRQTIEELGTSSKEIGHVVDLISSIAEDTNVLALNATIEAARAGEAGKGFAVVANEVKTLANQTAEATGDIKRRVERIQLDATRAVSAIDGVSTVINEISDSQHSIASAVEQQTATTAEIAAAVDDVAKTSEEIATSITSVASGSTLTSNHARRTKDAAGELTELATDLAHLSQANEPVPV